MNIQYKDLKKNDEIRTKQLGTPVSGKLQASDGPKQGRGQEKNYPDLAPRVQNIGMFDEHGSVWATDVTEVHRDGAWLQVTGQPA